MAQVSILDPPLPSRTVHQFPVPTWIENLAVRSNGQLLVTLISAPELFLVDPTDASKTVLIHRFPEVSGLSGVIEVEHDIFYVTGGVFDLKSFSNESGSYVLWEIDMTNFDKTSKAIVKKVMNLTKTGLLNGMELLSKQNRTILTADSEKGVVFKIDIGSREHEIAIDIDEMKNSEAPQVPIAINGIKIRAGYLYWTCTSKALFCRIKIDEDGTVAGDVEILEQGLVGDDFCFDHAGNVWLTQNSLNTLTVINAQGGTVTVAGRLDQLTIAGGTACQFDRKSGNEHILYLVTTGGLGGPVNGTDVEGGKVVAIDTSQFTY
ncbi:hypothetical protein F5884DRAFT_889234 [Xylogone sp. PMI_703]|nr:hypothetical protein F5884DRAFT_889234 [Xylogone sp. PMI_703]